MDEQTPQTHEELLALEAKKKQPKRKPPPAPPLDFRDEEPVKQPDYSEIYADWALPM